MNKTNLDMQALAKKLFRHKQGLRQVKLMHPKRDWLVGVLVGIIIMVMMVGWSAYTYLEKREAITLDATDIEAQIPVYRSDVVEDALSIFTARKERFEQLNQRSVVTSAPEPEVTPEVSTSTISAIPITATSSASQPVVEPPPIVSETISIPTPPTPIPPSPDNTTEADTPISLQ